MSLGSGLKRLRRSAYFWSQLPIRGATLGVRVLAPNSDGEVLMVRHGYEAGWHLPGGGVDRGELFEDAAHRELVEETGYIASGPLVFVGMTHNPRTWIGDYVAVFHASGLEHKAAFKSSFEIAEIGFFAPHALPETTTRATRARVEEWSEGKALPVLWSP